MSKHAYLIMEHSNLPVAQAALRMIDDPRNDVFIYIDGNEVHQSDFVAKYSHVYFLEQHIDVFWADFMQVEMALIELAVTTGHYGYYHLLTDAGLPIKTQDQIHEFFDNDPNQMIYMHVNCHTFKSIQRQCGVKYPFFKSKKFRHNKVQKVLAKIWVRTKWAFGVNHFRHNKEIPVVYNGWQAFSIPDDFARYLVEKKDLLHRTFDYALANEEEAFQSLAMNSKFRYRMYGYNGKDDSQDASKRMIKWNPQHWTPLVFTEKDFDEIKANKDCFFARKFYAHVDMKIVAMVEAEFSQPKVSK
jgi:hypothetical protein